MTATTPSNSNHVRFAYYVLALSIGAALTMLSYTYRLEFTREGIIPRIINRIHEERLERQKEREELAKERADRKAERDQWERENRRLRDLLRRKNITIPPPPETEYGAEYPIALRKSKMTHDSWECQNP